MFLSCHSSGHPLLLKCKESSSITFSSSIYLLCSFIFSFLPTISFSEVTPSRLWMLPSYSLLSLPEFWLILYATDRDETNLFMFYTQKRLTIQVPHQMIQNWFCAFTSCLPGQIQRPSDSWSEVCSRVDVKEVSREIKECWVV